MPTEKLSVMKLLTEATKRDPRASLLRSIPGFGVLTTSRWCAVVGDIARFDSPKQTMAFIGLVLNNRNTGQHTETSSGREARGQGKMSKRGDKMLRSLCILGAASLCISVRNDRLPDCPFVACIKDAPSVASTVVQVNCLYRSQVDADSYCSKHLSTPGLYR